MQKKKNHYHRYRKIAMGKNKDYIVYKCQDADCKNYVIPNLLIGKTVACFHCRDLFIVGAEQIRKLQLKLHCKSCTGLGASPHKGKERKNVSSTQMDTILQRLGLSAE